MKQTEAVTPTDLRERRHAHTRSEIVDAAIGLFEAQGYTAVTMDHIAAAAQISRRTLYRHFPSKERILLDSPAAWVTIWDSAVQRQPAHAPSLTVVESAARAVASAIDEQAPRLRRMWRLMRSIPELEPAFLANPVWIERMVALLTDPARGPVTAVPIAHVVAGAYAGAVDATMARWTLDDDTTVAAEIDVALSHLRPIWPQG